MLIDVLRVAGLDAMAQVDLGTRQNRHQSLTALSAMAMEVLAAAERRIYATEPIVGPLLAPDGTDFETRRPVGDERPPLHAVELGSPVP